MSSADASTKSAMSASFAWVTALSASVPLPRRRLARECERFVERAPSKAERGRADGHAEQVERLHADAEALARFADDRVGGNADIVVGEARERVGRNDLDPLGDCDRIGGDDESAESPRAPSPSPVRAKVT